MGVLACCVERESPAEKYNRELREQEEKEEQRRLLRVEKAEDYVTDTKVIKDKSTKGMDELQKFEVQLPFDNISIGGFRDIVFTLEETDGEKQLGYILYDKFVSKISAANSLWKQELSSRETITSQILLSQYLNFTDETGEAVADAIDIKVLMSLALLHCASDANDSAQIFYQVLQSGGIGSLGSIAYDDKDFNPCFERMCFIATSQIMKTYALFGNGEDKYSEEEHQKLADVLEDLREEWLDSVFDVESKLDALVWMKLVSKKENDWIYDPKRLREKIFTNAELDYRY